jgi:hypothetical protein
LFSWSIYNPAVVHLANIMLVIGIAFYWQRITLFKEYIVEKAKVSVMCNN